MRQKIIIIYISVICLASFTQCEQYFEANSDDILIDKDYIGNNNELYSGFIGLAAKVQSVADQGILLSGLRSDFLVPTTKAPQDLWDIYNFAEQTDNEYANPKGYYDIIVNANNYINKAHTYVDKNPNVINKSIFDGLVSGAVRYKIWAYLMLGKLYNEVAFFDDNLVEFKDISGFEKLRLTDGSLIDKLINQMLVGIELENGSKSSNGLNPILWDAILYPDGATSNRDLTWNMICPNKDVIMTELYLWDGNYEQVVNTGMNYLAREGEADQRKLLLTDKDIRGEWIQFWSRDPVTKTAELINVVPYDYERNQTNRLLDHFSNREPGKYLLRPSEAAMDRFYAQTRDNGLTKFDRYRGENYTFGLENGEWAVTKYTRGRENEVYKNNPHIVLYRAADIHMWIAEALVQMGQFKEAEAFLNDGAETYFANYSGEYEYPFDITTRNFTFILHWGIRRRIEVDPVYPPTVTKEEIEAETNQSTKDLLIAKYARSMDSLLVEETCMESAVEARSHPAMVRMALRYNDASIIADRVSAKYPSGQQAGVRDLLINDQSSWFIRFSLSDID